ncbi:hypothetical protein AYL99_01490 [Fonsecaea erecta]|uniref:Uncharacterized protein n=1 Tax=Fonsecaea erecta TaxID=1367422 RepID=A0A179A091_9EURO|nr:hypothetical protein AYL99_01490 [Fonsecaea erecta]OAP65518.1 hypothetical protein AYL99_01490 [Fonsecaea erecta]
MYRSNLARLQLELGLSDLAAKRLDGRIKELVVPPIVPDDTNSALNYGLDFHAIASSIRRFPELKPYFARTRSRNWETCFNNALYFWAHLVCGIPQISQKRTPVAHTPLKSETSNPPKRSESTGTNEQSTTPASFATTDSPESPDDVFVAPKGSSSQAAGDLWMRLYPGRYANFIEIRALSGSQEEVLRGRMQELFCVQSPPAIKKYGFDYVVSHCRKFLAKKRKAPPDAEVQLLYYIKMPTIASPIRIVIWDRESFGMAYDIWSSLKDNRIPFMLFLDDHKPDQSSPLMLPPPQISPSKSLESTQHLS